MSNSVSRLYEIVTKLKDLSEGTSCSKAFAEVFDLKSTELDILLVSFVKLIKLTKKAREDVINKNLSNQDKYLKPIDVIQSALIYIDFTGNDTLYKFSDKVDQETLIRLEYTIDMLDDDNSINDEKIDNILNELNSIESDIHSLDINKQLKAIFIINIYRIRLGLSQYKILGSEVLSTTLESSLGSILLNFDLAESEEEKEITKKFVGFISMTDQIISIVNNGRQLLEPILNFLK
ncbi:hypothetical protein [Paenibacillus sp. NPDC058174]|uniref:hypothetical protein n=1 Tax=Paenibacillus sp. NPDC058174 TaxID=3346366 RepID=UPI0036DAF730